MLTLEEKSQRLTAIKKARMENLDHVLNGFNDDTERISWLKIKLEDVENYVAQLMQIIADILESENNRYLLGCRNS